MWTKCVYPLLRIVGDFKKKKQLEQTMNEQDKKAFEKWYLEYPSWIVTMSCQESCSKAWQAACDYVRDEHKFKNPPAVFVYEEMYREQLIINKKLQAENAKLKECVEFYADYKNDDPDNDWNNDYAGQVLKQLDGK